MPTWKAKASRAAPRAAALLWAAFDLSRVLAYWKTSPPQLADIAAWVPLWIPWLIATILLTLGGLVPTNAGPRSRHAARSMRQWGITISVTLLMVWGVAFIVADASRGWVTALSYLMLATYAGICGWVASREVASIHAIREGETLAGMD